MSKVSDGASGNAPGSRAHCLNGELARLLVQRLENRGSV